MEYPLIYLEVPGIDGEDFGTSTIKEEWDPRVEILRDDEHERVGAVAGDNVTFTAHYSLRTYNRAAAIINIVRTLFVVVVLSLSSVYFTKDAQ